MRLMFHDWAALLGKESTLQRTCALTRHVLLRRAHFCFDKRRPGAPRGIAGMRKRDAVATAASARGPAGVVFRLR
jgi:hypothetical protein